jgi:hypothetical protein
MKDLIIASAKPKIFLFGACDLYQAVNIDTIKKEFDIDTAPKGLAQVDHLDFNLGLKPKYSTSLQSLYTKPNELANRVYDTIRNITKPKRYHYEVYREITKFPYLKYFKDTAGPNDILILNFSSELYTKLSVKSEKITIIPAPDADLKNINDEFHWLYKEYYTKNVYQIPFDNDKSLNDTYDLLEDFAKDIFEIFQDRVILVKTHMTNLALATDLKIDKIQVPLESHIPFFKPSRVMSDPVDHEYGMRVTNIFLTKFKRKYKADIPVVSIKEPVFVDFNHPYGYAPFHLHRFSNYKIGLGIYNELVKFKVYEPII